MKKFDRDELLPPDTVEMVFNWDSYPAFHNYEKEIKRLGKAGLIKNGEFLNLGIAHDNNCSSYNQERCDCNPDIIDRDTGQILNK